MAVSDVLSYNVSDVLSCTVSDVLGCTTSWEKGTNKNKNGLIRQYFTNQTNMDKFADEDAKYIEEALNNRPQKKLGFRTPKEFTTQEKVA